MNIKNLSTQIITDFIGQPYLTVVFQPDDIKPFLKLFHNIVPDFRGLIMNSNLLKRNHGIYHMTILTVPEYRKALGIYGPHNWFNITIDDIQLLGIGKATKSLNDETYYIVAESKTLNNFRTSLNYLKKSLIVEPKDFHITLGFDIKDIFGVRKNNVEYKL
jgi:hypothetical protein